MVTVNVLRIVCTSCSNSFFVSNGDEFWPNYCCYCGVELEDYDDGFIEIGDWLEEDPFVLEEEEQDDNAVA